jgi:hypothetical protein
MTECAHHRLDFQPGDWLRKPVICPPLADRESLLSEDMSVGISSERCDVFSCALEEQCGAKKLIAKNLDGDILLFTEPAD